MKNIKIVKKENGFSLIELLIVVVVIGVIAAIAVPNLMQARRASNEASAVSSISLIFRSEMAYKIAEGNGEFASLSELYDGNYIDSTLGTGANTKSGYRFETEVFASNSTTDARINILARPAVHSNDNSVTGTGGMDFGVNETGGIFSTTDNTAVSFDDDTRLATGTATPFDGS